MVQSTSDDFFARPDAAEVLGGVPLDLAFIDGMHQFEYALRDFMHLEHWATPESTTRRRSLSPPLAQHALSLSREQLIGVINFVTVHWQTTKWIDVQLDYLRRNVGTPFASTRR